VSGALVYGVGTTSFGRQPGRSAASLVWEAVLEALEDAAVGDVEAAYVGTVYGEMGVAQRALHRLGITGIPVLRVENACASGTTAFHEARQAILAGRYERVLAVGVEQMSDRFRGPIDPEPLDPEGRTGLALPALYALAASRYLERHGLQRSELAAVAIKNRRHGAANPRAQQASEVSEAEVLGSRSIADPLTLLQCSPISDGAAAAVLGVPRGVARDVGIRATALRSGELWDYRSEHVWGFDIVERTAAAALAEAGLSVREVDLLEVHDAFTIGEIVTTEALGLAPEGEGGRLAASGRTALGGRQPVNASGGLLSRGHPLGATGLAQVAEVVWQLRGEAGGRQVPDARVGLVETMGGGVAGIDGNACVVAVLAR
jgi:acetyl-CoA C-acetyltransferase